MKLSSQSLTATTDVDRGCRSMMESSSAISPGPENGQDPLFAPRRSYDDFEKALLQPVAAVAGIPGGKKRVTGTEVARFGALQTIGPTAVRAGGTIWRGGVGSGSRGGSPTYQKYKKKLCFLSRNCVLDMTKKYWCVL